MEWMVGSYFAESKWHVKMEIAHKITDESHISKYIRTFETHMFSVRINKFNGFYFKNKPRITES